MQVRHPIAIAFVLSFLSLTAPQSKAAASDDNLIANVFEEDNRVPMRETQLPWKYEGYLDLDNGDGHCTGTLVAPDLVLTAAHCFYDGTEGKRISQEATFYLGYKGVANASGVSSAKMISLYVGSKRFARIPGMDWAILRLDHKLSDVAEPLTVGDYSSATDLSGFKNNIEIGGYSQDFRGGQIAGLHAGCSLTNSEDGLFLDDCDLDRGSSGAAVFRHTDTNNYEIIGVNVAAYAQRNNGKSVPAGWSYDDSIANMATPSYNFYAILKALREGSAISSTNTAQICNKSTTHSTISVAIAYYDMRTDSWRSIGWYNTELGQCRTLSLPVINGPWGYYATASGGAIWSGSKNPHNPSICKRQTAFNFASADDKEMCDQMQGGMVTFTVGQRFVRPGDTLTINLGD